MCLLTRVRDSKNRSGGGPKLTQILLLCQQDLVGTTALKLIERRCNLTATGITYDGYEVRSIDAMDGPTYLVYTVSYEREVDRQFHSFIREHFGEPDLLLSVNYHSSENPMPILSVHATGNPTTYAPIGGTPEKLGIAPAGKMKLAIEELSRRKDEFELRDFSLCLEATHGPGDMPWPYMEVEVGSSPKEWSNEKAVEATVDAALYALSHNFDGRCLVGLCGGHYALRHTKVVLQSNYAIGHILTNHVITNLRPEMLREAAAKTVGGADFFVLDTKDKSEVKAKARELVESVGMRLEKDEHLMKLRDRSPDMKA